MIEIQLTVQKKKSLKTTNCLVQNTHAPALLACIEAFAIAS